MPREPFTRDISGQMVFLGTGTSVGVPVIGCGCAVCRSDNPRNHRTRCGVALGLPGGNLLVDTSPDLREQLLREQIGIVHAVVYTHEHVDHIYGLDDLRLMQFYLGGPVPLYCEAPVEARIRKSFDYAFDPPDSLPTGSVPKLVFHRIGLQACPRTELEASSDQESLPNQAVLGRTVKAFDVLGMQVQPIRLHHGPRLEVLGFRFGKIAYCTDTNRIPESSMQLLEGLDVLVLGCLRRQPSATHFRLDEALEVADKLQPRRTLLTHLSHDMEHDEISAILPSGVELAHDGLQIPLS